MFEFIELAEGMQKVYAYFGVFGSTIFVIINVLVFVGLLDDFGLDVDLDVEAFESTFTPFKLVTFKGIMAFIMFFGWGGYLTESFILALLIGFIAFVLIGLIYHFSRKLTQKGNYNIQDAVGRIGSVYLRMKGNKESTGKVHIELSTGLKEMNAISEEPLEYGDKVVVLSIEDDILVVKKHEEEN